MRFVVSLLAAALLCDPALDAQHPTEVLMETVRNGEVPQADLLRAIDKRWGKLEKRTVADVWGQDALFATSSEQPVTLSINGTPPEPMQRAAQSNIWYSIRKLQAGTTYGWQMFAGGKPLNDRTDLPAYGPDSYPNAGVARGVLSEKRQITSRVYDGMKADYWIYASPGVDPARPSALMVWQDGETIARDAYGGPTRLFIVIENLVAQKLMPPSVHVLIAPGQSRDGKDMRSIEYDTVSPRYGQFVINEVLAEVEKTYKLRADGYSRAIGGRSSGGICSFNMAWHFPEQFARVHSTIGSYTSIQWQPDQKQEGGNVYPFKVRKESKRNIRVWLSDGLDDLENEHGSWPLQNIQMANSLKMREYDFHFRFDESAHNSAREAVDLPESLAWLWRGYDAAKTSEQFVMDPAEKNKPYFRVRIVNRDAR
jgi:enterochelin esterase family protein